MCLFSRRSPQSRSALRTLPAVSALAATVFAVLAAGAAHAAPTFKRLHAFCLPSDCKGGNHPQSALLLDSDGNLYGTTSSGGSHGYGLVFKFIPNGDKSKYGEHVIHTFCAKDPPNCTDGSTPDSDLIMDTAGNLYGTAANGGKKCCGIVYRLTPNGTGWSFTVLHNFGADDGTYPEAGLTYAGQASGAPWDGSSPLYGTTSGGGQYVAGIAYQLVHSGSTWPLTVIHNFHSAGDPGPLLMDASGNLFGTAAVGGVYEGGLMYKLAGKTWKQTILRNFCKEADCADGEGPSGRLLMDASGNLFGTTVYGGSNDGGVIFKRTAGGSYKVIHNFSYDSDQNPVAGLLMDASGNLFGTTFGGGFHGDDACSGGNFGAGCGAVFEQTAAGQHIALYQFCATYHCPDGANPAAALAMDKNGYLYGSTTLGGNDDNGRTGGTIFRIQR
ncbi:MAG TPA: choice-of-anchor tandem repeat GloVer-containing protein [Rhizomicrobium sp.]|nr:choice-of-anchor tandem repeat GloVer-containing protein [Rhizomicrobium sp.]